MNCTSLPGVTLLAARISLLIFRSTSVSTRVLNSRVLLLKSGSTRPEGSLSVALLVTSFASSSSTGTSISKTTLAPGARAISWAIGPLVLPSTLFSQAAVCPLKSQQLSAKTPSPYAPPLPSSATSHVQLAPSPSRLSSCNGSSTLTPRAADGPRFSTAIQ